MTTTSLPMEPDGLLPPDDEPDFHPREYEALRQRLGDARLRQRLRQQIYHVAGESHQQGIFLKFKQFVDVDKAIVRVARLSGLYGWGYRNFRDIRVVNNVLRHPRVPRGLEGLRILQLSDLHLDLDGGMADLIAERIRGLEYDLAVLTGDFRNTTHADHGLSVRQTRRLVAALKPPTYAILGNHDFVEIVPPLERAGVRFLLNETVVVDRNGDQLHLGGVDDVHFYRTHDFARVREAIPDDAFSILLCHSPEGYLEASSHGFDVMLSGHTHGGQICLPGGYVLIKVCDVPRNMLSGNWDFRSMAGYTSVGTGSCGVPLRYFCPPEITLHTLARQGHE